MIQHSGLSSKEIYDKFCKLQRATSDYRFRAKSLRVKTINNDLDEHIVQKIGLPVIYPNQSTTKFNPKGSQKKITLHQQSSKNIGKSRCQSYKIIQKNYEEELYSIGVDREFLGQLFQKKCQETQTNYTQHKYQAFVKNLYQRLSSQKYLSICHMGLGPKALQFFFSWYISWQSHISEVNLTYSGDLLKEHKIGVIKSLLTEDKKLMKITLCNSGLQEYELSDIFKIVNQEKHLFSLDIGNQNSQDLNRLGSDYSTFQDFFHKNSSVAIVKLNNLNIKREGFESLCRGVFQRKSNPLRILSLANNYISGGKICEHFYNLLKSGLTHLDLSYNPLGEEFFKNIPPLKGITLKQLKLVATNMCSQNLITLFEKLQESKTLSVLKADNNNFSHHWFIKIGEKLQVNSSLLWLSLNNCQIKTLTPLFQGLTHNKVLKRLDANNNEVDSQSQDLNKITTFFKFNKDLEEIRIKFSSLKENFLQKLMSGLSKNKKLKILDISQNFLEDQAATEILKMLEENMVIEKIGIQKLQLSQLMRKRIMKKLEENAVIREREEFARLKNQASEMKATDNYTWSYLSKLESQQRRLNEYAQTLEEKTDKLESKITKKKSDLLQLIKDNKDEDRYLQSKIQDRLRQTNERTRTDQKQYEIMKNKEQSLKDEIEKQMEKAKQLEQKIKEINLRNKAMESQYEDKLRNHRYLQRKKSKNQNLVSFEGRRSNCAVHPQR